MKRVIIIGAGASGMFCALLLRERGWEVTVLERNEKIMKKIYATGNGRCNFTNRNCSPKNYHGKNPKFVMSALNQCTNNDTISIFRNLGIPEIELEEGKIYPLSLQASSIPYKMEEQVIHRGVKIEFHTFVKDIKKNKEFKLTTEEGKIFTADKVIVATGGRAMERSGSDGNGYTLAKSFGIPIVDTHPGIVQLQLDYPYLRRMDGTKIPGSCTLIIDGKKGRKEFSDILFTRYGISGPAILQISSEAIRSIRKGKDVELSIDILPMLEENELYYSLLELFQQNSFFTLETGLTGIIHKNLIVPLLRDLNYDKDKKIAEMSKEEIHLLQKKLKDYRFKVIDAKSDNDGQVTCGGVSTKEINPKTMEVKSVSGLYFIGEILDIDGDCGGYNLQWAWSSAYACAMNIDE